jgi:hypothetical protein
MDRVLVHETVRVCPQFRIIFILRVRGSELNYTTVHRAAASPAQRRGQGVDRSLHAMEYTAAPAAARVAGLGSHRARSLAARTPAARLHRKCSRTRRRCSAAARSPCGHGSGAGRRRAPGLTEPVQRHVACDQVGVAEGRRRVDVHLQERPLVVGQARRRVRVLAPPCLWTPRCFVLGAGSEAAAHN